MTAKQKPCKDAVYGGRGEWYCNTHKRADPDSGCPPEPKPKPEAGRGGGR